MLLVCSGCRISRYSEKSQNPEVVIPPRKRFSQKWCFDGIETTVRKDGNARKDHEKISCSHQNIILWRYSPVNFMFCTKTRIFVFLYGKLTFSWHHVLVRGCLGRRLLLQIEELSSQQPLVLLNYFRQQYVPSIWIPLPHITVHGVRNGLHSFIDAFHSRVSVLTELGCPEMDPLACGLPPPCPIRLPVACGSRCVTGRLWAPRSFKAQYYAFFFLTETVYKTIRNAGLFLIPLLCLSTHALSTHVSQIITHHEKWRPGMVPGALGRALGAILGPRLPRAQKSLKKWLGGPPPWSFNFTKIKPGCISSCFFCVFFRDSCFH